MPSEAFTLPLLLGLSMTVSSPGVGSGWQAVELDGKLLANASTVLFDDWRIAMGLNRYIFAAVDNFAIM